MGLIETTMKNWLVSESSWNDLLNIASTILFHLIEGPQKMIYLPLMRSMMEIQFLLAVHFIFLVIFLPPQQSALFPTWLSAVPHQYLLVCPSAHWRNNSLNPFLSYCSVSYQLLYGVSLISSMISPISLILPMVEITVVELFKIVIPLRDFPTL